MQKHNKFLNSTGSGGLGGYSELISTALDFGVQYLTAQKENKRNEELLQRMSELDNQQAEKLKKLIKDSVTEIAKTEVIIDFLNQSEIKKLQDKSKKDRILPLIGLGFGIILISLIFYKFNKQTKNG